MYCRIERAVIDEVTEATSVRVYCKGDCTLCPTWRAHKEAIWADGAKSMDRELRRTARAIGRT